VIRTVDLVVADDENAALAAAVDAVQGGRRVLLVLGGLDARRFRRDFRRVANGKEDQLTVITNAQVCVEGIGSVEAVVIRISGECRPVAVLELRDGSLLVSDDGGKKIWRIAYRTA
jgi:hypothetical protein